MTNEDFKDWLAAYGCTFEPIDGMNHIGWSMKITNPRTGNYTYLSGPFDDRKCPRHIIRDACLRLGVEQPDYTK